ncbi:MAG: hypothetical protein MHPSP_000023 [Paramarteilia canceri]
MAEWLRRSFRKRMGTPALYDGRIIQTQKDLKRLLENDNEHFQIKTTGLSSAKSMEKKQIKEQNNSSTPEYNRNEINNLYHEYIFLLNEFFIIL